MKKIYKLLKEEKQKAILKEYKNGTLFLESNVSWVDEKIYFYLSFKDKENDIFLFNKSLYFKNNIEKYYLYKIYSIYTDKTKKVKSKYIKNIMDIIEKYNGEIRKKRCKKWKIK